MSCMLIAKGRSRGGTDHSTIAFWGACRRKVELHERLAGRALDPIKEYCDMPAEAREYKFPNECCHLCGTRQSLFRAASHLC